MRAYNDWLAEFCSEDTSRLKGIAMVNVDDPDDGARELARCRDLGLCGALITVAPPAWSPFRDASYDRFWAAAQDLDMPLSLHIATDRADPKVGDAAFRLDVKHVPPSVFVNKDFQVRQTLADLILVGRVRALPEAARRQRRARAGVDPVLPRPDGLHVHAAATARRLVPVPASQVRCRATSSAATCFSSFQEDAIGIRVRDVIGVDTLMWGSDYPHTESTFPRSREILGQILEGVEPGDVLKIVATNAADLYHFDRPETRP